MSDPHQVSHHAEHAAADADTAAHDPASHSHVNYWAIFGALCILTAVSWIADELKGSMGAVLLVLVVLTVASFKAMFVMLYFMHLKFEGKWKFVLLAPTTVLALAIVAGLMPDIGSHYYEVQVPQLHEAPAQAAHADAEGHEAPKPAH
jgi:cytochrome c oxidase subunit 4